METPQKPGSKVYYRTGVVVLLMVCLVEFAGWVSTPESRYQFYPDHYQMIFRQKGPIDLAAMGSSRLKTAFDGRLMAERLAQRLGRETVVYDLCRDWRGNGIAYVMLRDLFERRKVGHLVLEYKANGPATNANFEQAALFKDIVESAWVKRGKPPWWRIHEILVYSSGKVTRQLSLWLTGARRRFDPKMEMPARTTDPNSVYPIVSGELYAMRAEFGPGWNEKPDRHWPVVSDDEYRNAYYLGKIIDLARAHKTTVTLVHIPVLYETPLDPVFIARVEQALGLKLLCMNRDELKRIYPAGFADSYHANGFGAAFFTDWLAGKLFSDRSSAVSESGPSNREDGNAWKEGPS